jgi:hypothetical protein
MKSLLENKVLVILAVLFVGYGLLKPDLSNINWPRPTVVNNEVVKVEAPKDAKLLKACESVIKSLKSGPRSRSGDAARLSSLYYDLSTLIELDNEDEVIKDTLAIRESNKLAGALSRLGLGGKYPDLAEACNSVVVAGIGDEDIVLDKETRKKAVDTFKALSWACYEGSK